MPEIDFYVVIESRRKLEVGAKVKDSPVGSGEITDFTEAGFPRVNHVAVSWLVLEDGGVFDPHGIYDSNTRSGM